MTTGVSVQARKELRELLPWWGGLVVAIVACGQAQGPSTLGVAWTGIGLLAYAGGAISLGALAIGHEYSNHTLPTLLMQPAPRTQLLLIKAGVLLALLVGLVVVTAAVFDGSPISRAPRFGPLAGVPVLCAICLTPWLTMVLRGPLAGAVVSGAAVVFLFPLGSALGLPYTAVPSITLLLTGVGALMTWRTFVRLEVSSGPPTWARRPVWRRATDSDTAVRRTQHPIVLLLNKELRIQTMTCVVAGLFVAVWLATSAADSMSPLWVPPSTIYVVASLYQGLVALMTGALAIAEERRFGTVDWQALLPWPVWKQWAVKIGITVSLALVLAVVVPRVLATMLPSPWNLDYDIVAILMPCIAALYVSSLSRTGFRAFLATLPFIGVASLLGVLIVDPLSQYSREAFGPLATQLQAFIRFDRADFHWLTGSAGGSLVGGFALLMLRFAYVNYRHGDLNRPRVARQVLWMSAYAVGGLLLASLVGAMFLVFLAQSG